jgi:3-deoxy-D-manno-octulosonate 8-phosphate phosphatase (KDO 8-P phosphatase)
MTKPNSPPIKPHAVSGGERRAPRAPRRLGARLKRIRCVLMDVDGVLTDGKLHFTSDGREFKSFDVQDGHGIAMAQRAGMIIGFVSGRPSRATELRARELSVPILMQKAANKMEMVEQIKRDHGLSNEEICFIGDELVDLPVLRRVGLAVAVPNAMDEVKAMAHYVTRRRGGDGAVRELLEMVLKARGLWRRTIAKYLALGAAAWMLGAGWVAAQPPAGRSGGSDGPIGYIEKFEVPELDEQGNIKWKLFGDRAQLRPDGLMNIFNMRAQFYAGNEVDMVFTAPTCVLDRANKRATTDGPVRIERPNMVLTGVGANWVGETSSFVLHSHVQVIITDGGAVFAPAEKPRAPAGEHGEGGK